MRITVSGQIGCGKSTLSKALCDHFSMDYFSTGDIFREMAGKSGMSLEEYSRYAESNPSIDRSIDDQSISFLRRNDNVVADSRLSGWLTYRNGIDAIRIWLSASLEERVRRVSGREKGSPEEIRMRIVEREESEIRRYREFYSIDMSSMEPYHIVVLTDGLGAEEVLSIVLKKMEETGSWTVS